MSQEDKFMILLDKVQEISERTARMEVQQQHMEYDLNFIKEEDRKQNELLAEHIQGTVTNRARLDLEIENRKFLQSKVDEAEERIERLEAFPKFLKSFKAVIIYSAAVIAAIYKIGSYLGKW